jgi:thiol-disulfide isomerase/thioredoxin
MIPSKALAAILSCSLLAGFTQASAAQQEAPARPTEKTVKEKKPYALGDKIDGSIALRDIDGKLHELKSYRGKILVLDFWSVRCPWSIGYEERFKAFHEKHVGKDLAFLAINPNHTEVDAEAKDPYALIRKYVKEQKLPYPILIDEGNVIADRFDARTTPHVFVIDAAGKLVYRGSLDDDPKGERGEEATPFLANVIAELRAGKEVSVPETRPKGCSIKRVKRDATKSAKKPVKERK